MGCFSGCLMSSASDHNLFCGVFSVFKCSFDEFVGEKVVSPSYSSAILVTSLHIRPFRTNNQKRCPFHYRGQECKSRKSRNTWSNRQNWPWSTEWSREKAHRVLPREHTGHSKHPVPTTQEKTLHMDIIRWPIPKSDWYYLQPKMEKLYTVSKNKTGSWLWLRLWIPYCQIQT